TAGKGSGPAAIPDLLDSWRRAEPGSELQGVQPEHWLAGKLARLGAPVAEPELLRPLAAYLDALSATACPARDAMPLTLAEDLFELTRALGVLQQQVGSAPRRLSGLLLGNAQARLDALHARFALPGLEAQARGIRERRATLVAAASDRAPL